nr:aldehyde dehydrogenase family 3 member F1 [Tanacetum cinerariifolium]
AEQKRVLEQTHSGGVCLNDTLLHVAQDDLPFGGIGASGMGHYHGHEGVTASLSGCSSQTAAPGFSVLRASDMPFLQAVIPVMLEGATAAVTLRNAVDATLHSLDSGLAGLSPEMLK